jgi:PncC family amidohydrolase
MENERKLLNAISKRLLSKGSFLTTAESCTGGLLGHLITSLPGSSDFYLGGHIAYSNLAKQEWLKVPEQILNAHGAVSREVVLIMAENIREALSGKVNIGRIMGISISGIAGPSGGTPEKPVGTVWIGVSTRIQSLAYRFTFKGSRDSIKEQCAIQALEILKRETSKL